MFPVYAVAELALKQNVPVLAGGARAAPNMPVNMQNYDCHFYAFTGRKVGSPSLCGCTVLKALY
jgi:cysteine desulfurase/selenocysteine lyase